MICRGALLPVSFVAGIDSGNKTTPTVAIRFVKILALRARLLARYPQRWIDRELRNSTNLYGRAYRL